MDRRTVLTLVGVAVGLPWSLLGCRADDRFPDPDRFVTVGSPHPSPSGDFVASVLEGPERDGAATRLVVITDGAGTEVFRDDREYSTRHGVGVTWLSTGDQLWILSGGEAPASVQPTGGVWRKTSGGAHPVPAEITDLT